MSRSYWSACRTVARSGVTIACGLLLLAALVSVAPYIAHNPSNNQSANQQISGGSKNDDFPVLQVIIGAARAFGRWAGFHHNAIEAFSALGGLVFSAVLTGSTILLWRETRSAAHAGAEQARLTKKSMKLARDEFIASHRPRLRIRRIYLTRVTIGEGMDGEVWVSNVGETPAKITAFGVDVFAPDWTYNADSKPMDILLPKIEAGKQVKIDFQIRRVITEDQIVLIKSKTLPLKALGSITYLDDANVSRFTSFSRVYDYELRRFVPVAADDPEGDREYED